MAQSGTFGSIHDCVFYGNLFIKSADIPTISPPALSENNLETNVPSRSQRGVWMCMRDMWRRQVSLAGDANPPRRVNANVPSLLHKISAHSTGTVHSLQSRGSHDPHNSLWPPPDSTLRTRNVAALTLRHVQFDQLSGVGCVTAWKTPSGSS